LWHERVIIHTGITSDMTAMYLPESSLHVSTHEPYRVALRPVVPPDAERNLTVGIPPSTFHGMVRCPCHIGTDTTMGSRRKLFLNTQKVLFFLSYKHPNSLAAKHRLAKVVNSLSKQPNPEVETRGLTTGKR